MLPEDAYSLAFDLLSARQGPAISRAFAEGLEAGSQLAEQYAKDALGHGSEKRGEGHPARSPVSERIAGHPKKALGALLNPNVSWSHLDPAEQDARVKVLSQVPRRTLQHHRDDFEEGVNEQRQAIELAKEQLARQDLSPERQSNWRESLAQHEATLADYEARTAALDSALESTEPPVQYAAHSEPAPVDEDLWQACLAILPAEVPETLPHHCGDIHGVPLWLVDGNAVKLLPRKEKADLGYDEPDHMDFVEGGNSAEDPDLRQAIPQPEGEFILIDANLQPHCWPFISYHEGHELRDMLSGLHYDHAHVRANAGEKILRERAREQSRPVREMAIGDLERYEADAAPKQLTMLLLDQDGEELGQKPLGSAAEWEEFARWAAEQEGELARLAYTGHSDEFAGPASLTRLWEQLEEASEPPEHKDTVRVIVDALRSHPSIEGIVVTESESEGVE